MGVRSKSLERGHSMAAKPAVDLRALGNKKQDNKKWNKKLKLYGGCFVGVALVLAFLWSAESGRAAERNWAVTYERRCEACQTMIVSGVMTRSMIYQQEKKRIDEERKANPEYTLEEPQPVKASVVLRYMCDENQLDQMLTSQHISFGDGFVTSEDPNFASSLKKLCYLAISNSTMSTIFKRMLDAPMEPMKKPTLVSASAVHFAPVCGKLSGMCSAEQLEHAMVDPAAAEAETPDATAQTATPAGAEAPSVGAGAGDIPAGEHTEL